MKKKSGEVHTLFLHTLSSQSHGPFFWGTSEAQLWTTVAVSKHISCYLFDSCRPFFSTLPAQINSLPRPQSLLTGDLRITLPGRNMLRKTQLSKNGLGRTRACGFLGTKERSQRYLRWRTGWPSCPSIEWPGAELPQHKGSARHNVAEHQGASGQDDYSEISSDRVITA